MYFINQRKCFKESKKSLYPLLAPTYSIYLDGKFLIGTIVFVLEL